MKSTTALLWNSSIENITALLWNSSIKKIAKFYFKEEIGVSGDKSTKTIPGAQCDAAEKA
jgi:hypothetical protein